MEFAPNGLVSSHFSDYEINTSQIFHTPDCTPPASPSASFSGCEKLLGDADQYDEEAAQLVCSTISIAVMFTGYISGGESIC